MNEPTQIKRQWSRPVLVDLNSARYLTLGGVQLAEFEFSLTDPSCSTTGLTQNRRPETSGEYVYTDCIN